MFQRKVYPGTSDDRDELLTVDDVVESVDKEIAKITSEVEAFSHGLSTQPYSSSNRNNSSDTNTKQQPIRQQQQQQTYQQRDGEDEVEEIRLSHEIFNSEEKVTEELESRFIALKQHVEEYRNLYRSSADKLRGTEAKVSELESKVDILEEERIRLEEQLKANTTNNNSNNNNVMVNRTNTSGQLSSADAQRRAEELRKALLFEDDENNLAIDFESLLQSKNVFAAIMEYLSIFDPFKRDISTIHARFGSSVASYFLFTRYLINQMLIIAAISIAFLILHCIYLANRSLPHRKYLSRVGIIPYVMSYSSFATNEGLAYDCFVLVMLLFIVVSILNKLRIEDKNVKTLESFDEQNQSPFSKELLASWDYSRSHINEIDELCGSFSNNLLLDLEETRTKGIKRARSRYETFLVYSRRTIGMILFIMVVASSFTAILYVTFYGSSISTQVTSATGLNVDTLVVPLILFVVNSALPTALTMITENEGWDTAATVTRLVLFRLYLASTLNTLLLIFSYLVLADPFLLATTPSFRNSFGLKISTQFSCRLDQVAEGLFSLVGITWGLSLVTGLATPLGYQLLAYIRNKPYVKEEFSVANEIVKRLSFMGLVFASVPFCPLALIFVPMYLILQFKFEKLLIKRFYSKPKRPWAGQKAGFVYLFFYLASFLLVGLTVSGYFFTSKTFAKKCSEQDNHVRLCLDAVGSAGTNLCTVDTSSAYYHSYKSDYPNAICSGACGPFINQASHLSPFHHLIKGIDSLNAIFMALFDYPYLPWAATIALTFVVVALSNSIEVGKMAAAGKLRVMETQLQSVEAERKKQEKIITKLKSIETIDILDGGGSSNAMSVGGITPKSPRTMF